MIVKNSATSLFATLLLIMVSTIADAAPTCQAVKFNYEQGVIDAIIAARDKLQIPVAVGTDGTLAVTFDLLDGSISNLHMAASSGVPAYDRAALSGVREAALPVLPPQLRGYTLHMTVPIRFYSNPQDQAYARMVELSVNAAKRFPTDQLESGMNVISFDMQGGSANNIHIDVSSGSRAYDASAIHAVKDAALPPSPPELSGRKLHIVIPMDFRSDDLNGDYDTEVASAVEHVFSSLGIAARPFKTSEVVISFDVLDGSMMDMRLDFSSGDSLTDQETMNAARKAVIPAPPPRLQGCKVHVEAQRFLR